MTQHYWRGDVIEEWKKAGIYAVCEATDFEKFTIWQTYSEGSSDCKMNLAVKWEQGNPGCLHTIPGKGFNTTISMWVDILDGKACLFWHGTSEKCDFSAAEKWIDETFKPAVRSDPTNFHIIIHSLRGT